MTEFGFKSSPQTGKDLDFTKKSNRNKRRALYLNPVNNSTNKI